MNDSMFKNLGDYLFEKMIQGETITALADQMDKLKFYIYSNHNRIEVNRFIEKLLRFNLSLFKDDNLLKALETPDSLPYLRQAEIYKNLPYTKCPNYAQFLPQFLVIPSELYCKDYATFMYLLKKYLPEEAEDSVIKDIYTFIDNNGILLRSYKDEYGDINKEIELYTRVQKGELLSELKDFALDMRVMDSYDVIPRFMNKRIGNIGELYAFNFINKSYKLFVSRDIGNGFGYDIYFLDEDNIETLVEVKTTTSFGEDDCFALSENEYQTMVNTLENPKARYIVMRVVLNKGLNKPEFIVLVARDEKTLIGIDNKYVLEKNENGKYIFTAFNRSRVIK